MTDMIESVVLDEDEKQVLAQRLVDQAKAEGVDLIGPGGLLSGLTKTVLETALEEEMAEDLGYDKHDPLGRNGGNSRSGSRSKTVLTAIGPVELDVPRDRDGSFEPKIVKKRQRRLDGVDQIVLSLTARGLTTGEVAAHFADVYDVEVSKDTVSRITGKVIGEMSQWQTRPLDRVYPVIFIDALVVKVRDGQATNKPFYVVIGVTASGERDILGIWAGDGGEGTKFWLQVLTEIKNRGVEDVMIAVCDGLKGLPRRDRSDLGVDPGPDLHHPSDPQHVPLRGAAALGEDGAGPTADLHRDQRRAGRRPARRLRREVGVDLSSRGEAVAQRLG